MSLLVQVDILEDGQDALAKDLTLTSFEAALKQEPAKATGTVARPLDSLRNFS